MPQKRKRHLPLATAAPSPEEALHAPSAVNPAAPPSDVPDGIPVADDPVHNPLLYNCRKRLPMRAPAGKHDIFVSRSTRFGALKARALALLDASKHPVLLHAMGAAITLCCNLALVIQEETGGHVALTVHTSTVDVYDDYEPLVEGYPHVTRSRSKSAIRIRLSRTPGYV